jgi:hypothetical protein
MSFENNGALRTMRLEKMPFEKLSFERIVLEKNCALRELCFERGGLQAPRNSAKN